MGCGVSWRACTQGWAGFWELPSPRPRKQEGRVVPAEAAASLWELLAELGA